jgi:protoporphyrin/coproporphyrin ferrochelatase
VDSKTAILIFNVGTPDDPSTPAVRRYLSEFLNDERIIDIPRFFRKILVDLIIVPFRAPKSARIYRKLWTDKGSPLLVNGLSLRQKLQEAAGADYIVEYASSYQHPNIIEVTDQILAKGVSRIVLFPLFPQYSSSTTGSGIEKLLKHLAAQYNIPSVSTVLQYFDNPFYLGAMASLISRYNYKEYDHILMSYHGLPVKMVNKSHNGNSCQQYNCTTEINDQNIFCYQASCYGTSRLLAKKLDLDDSQYSVSFQSRISRNWLLPFTDEIIVNLAKEGKKKLLVICPSFTADCLETIIEAGEDYRDLFLKNGGSEFTLVESLNDSDIWVDAIWNMIGFH